MWHRLDDVADNWKFDRNEFVAFATSNHAKYGIVTENGVPEVNTWHANSLIDDFRANELAKAKEKAHTPA